MIPSPNCHRPIYPTRPQTFSEQPLQRPHQRCRTEAESSDSHTSDFLSKEVVGYPIEQIWAGRRDLSP